MSSNILNVDELVKIVNGVEEFPDAENDPLLPQHSGGIGGFRWLISGPSGTGKTNLIVSVIMTGGIHFDHLYLYIRDPTQPKYNLLIKWLNTLQEKFKKEKGEEVSIYTVITDPEAIIPVDDLDSELINLVVFDDMLLEKNQKMIIEYFVRGRHRSCDCVYMTQSYYLTDITLRKQCNYYSVFGVNNKRELDTISSDLSMFHDPKEFKEIFSKALQGKNSFLFVDRRTDLNILKIRKQFDGIWVEEQHRFVKYKELINKLK